MTILYRRSPPKPAPAKETHDSITYQTEAYLRQGGAITLIPSGYTGVDKIAGPKQMHSPQRSLSIQPLSQAKRHH